jgi:RimJ/RimL family protein N-acetyltransferase
MYYKKLIGSQCYLSPCALADAEAWTRWFNDLDVALPLGDEAYVPFSLERTQADASAMIQSQAHVFSIVDLATDQLIGRCLLFSIDPVNRSAMFGIAIGEKAFWNQGYGVEATRLTLDYGFNLLNLNSIMLGVMAFNQGAIRCYQKAGFKEIGRRRQARIIGGRKFDGILMDILAEEFSGSVVQNLLPKA